MSGRPLVRSNGNRGVVNASRSGRSVCTPACPRWGFPSVRRLLPCGARPAHAPAPQNRSGRWPEQSTRSSWYETVHTVNANCALWGGRMDAVRRPVRRPRPLTEQQLHKRVQAAMDEVGALGAGHQLSARQIRYRLLLLERKIQEVLTRWPEDLSGCGPTRHRRPGASAGVRSHVALGAYDTEQRR